MVMSNLEMEVEYCYLQTVHFSPLYLAPRARGPTISYSSLSVLEKENEKGFTAMIIS